MNIVISSKWPLHWPMKLNCFTIDQSKVSPIHVASEAAYAEQTCPIKVILGFMGRNASILQASHFSVCFLKLVFAEWW